LIYDGIAIKGSIDVELVLTTHNLSRQYHAFKAPDKLSMQIEKVCKSRPYHDVACAAAPHIEAAAQLRDEILAVFTAYRDCKNDGCASLTNIKSASYLRS
jgi:hypothetical protein